MPGELIPITLFLSIAIVAFAFRYFINREKMAMIERGIDPGIAKSIPKPFLSLKTGLLLVGLGLGLLVAMICVRVSFGSSLSGQEPLQVTAIYFGCVLVFGGLGLIVSYVVEKKWMDKQ
ncbi:DUF6249 domain-containing protein [Pedobacter sp.]|uniref:DUF6249 domain-containing protein n=1 Tax=Pedobacter sp. TaxID=1411316 RepID=UPI00396CE9A5